MGEQSTINIERNLEFDRHTAEDSESTGFTRAEVIIIRHDELLVKQVFQTHMEGHIVRCLVTGQTRRAVKKLSRRA